MASFPHFNSSRGISRSLCSTIVLASIVSGFIGRPYLHSFKGFHPVYSTSDDEKKIGIDYETLRREYFDKLGSKNENMNSLPTSPYSTFTKEDIEVDYLSMGDEEVFSQSGSSGNRYR